MSDVFSDAQTRYDEACSRRQAVADTWEEQGRPLLTTGSTGQLVEHPLVKQLNELDRLCDKLGESLRKKAPGRSPVAVVKASVGKSPAAERRARKLRAVS